MPQFPCDCTEPSFASSPVTTISVFPFRDLGRAAIAETTRLTKSSPNRMRSAFVPPVVCSQIGERQCMLWHSLGAIQLNAGSFPFLTSFRKNGSRGLSNFAHDPSPPLDVGPRSVNQNAGLW